MMVDPKKSHLDVPMDSYEYMQFLIDIILQEIIEEYNLMYKANNGLSCVKYSEKYIDWSRRVFWKTN